MTTLIIIICAILLLVGLLGCFIPVIPGPPLAYIALLILSIFTDYKCSDEFLWQWAGIVIIVTIADFWLQIYGVKKFGGTKKAVNGTMIGLFVGIFVPIPIGFIVGPFIGALVGAYLDEKDDIIKVIKIASGALIGFVGGPYTLYQFAQRHPQTNSNLLDNFLPVIEKIIENNKQG